MLDSRQLEQLIRVVATMGREDLARCFLDFPGTFPVDFTPAYLAQLPLERLRHIFVALCLQCGRVPTHVLSAAA